MKLSLAVNDDYSTPQSASSVQQYSINQTRVQQYPLIDQNFQKHFVLASTITTKAMNNQNLPLLNLDKKKEKRSQGLKLISKLSSAIVPLSFDQTINQQYGLMPVIIPSETSQLRKTPKIPKLKLKASNPLHLRQCAGETWIDRSITDWPDNDFRIFVGDLGNEVSDAMLTTAFSKYPSFSRAKVIRDKRNGKSRGYGFISFLDPQDFLRALKEMEGQYVGNRPIKVKKSKWKERIKKIKDFKPGLRPNKINKRYNDPGPI